MIVRPLTSPSRPTASAAQACPSPKVRPAIVPITRVTFCFLDMFMTPNKLLQLLGVTVPPAGVT